ncbi:MAG: hypothetical protein OEY23_19695 [Acidimicrobiia bacterium]|nr:hypothetical protein [Acidimicrobiia bacterium]
MAEASLPGPVGGSHPALDGLIVHAESAGQLRAALRQPVHAYLFSGPRGSGKRAAARAFAAEILAGSSTGSDAERHRRLALAEAHPDLEVFEREGASLSREQARQIVERSVRSPMEGDRKVIVLPEFQLALDAAPILLKAIEEPPPTTMFVVLVDELAPELATVASRCVVIPFAPLAADAVAAALVIEGTAPDTAARAAEAAGGDIERARLLATDPGLVTRLEFWRAVPTRLDGTGAVAGDLVAEVTALIDAALTPLDERHQGEAEELAEREERYGAAAGVRKTLEARHRRERRRLRTEELRFGFAVLSRLARDRAVVGHGDALGALTAIHDATVALERNPNETLLLLRLFARLRPFD